MLVFSDEANTTKQTTIEVTDTSAMLRKWFDTAIFYLYKADYLRNHDIRTVQAIAILGIVFNNVGEYNLHLALWSSAVRIAQALKVDNETMLATKSPIEREVSRRVWWTLVICEWFALSLRSHPKCIYLIAL